MLQQILRSAAGKFILFISVLFIAQAAKAGGDIYEIYLNKKLLDRHYVYNLSEAVMNLSLDGTTDADNLIIYYSHCGIVGKGRRIVITNEQNRVLGTWEFANVSSKRDGMVISLKELRQLKKAHAQESLKLYYYAEDLLPKGRMLVTLKPSGKATVFLMRPAPWYHQMIGNTLAQSVLLGYKKDDYNA